MQDDEPAGVMANNIAKTGSPLENFLLLAALIIILSLALNAGYLPIYPDEISYKIFLERFFLNGGFKQSLTPYCPEGFLVGVPLPLIPAAASWSTLRLLGGDWLSYRLVPFLAFGTTMGLLAINGWRKGDPGIWRSLLIVAAGPAIYGLIILRPESLIIFAGLILFFVARRLSSSSNLVAILVLSSFALFVFSFVAFVHPKALYLTPLLWIGLLYGALAIPVALYRWIWFCGTMLASLSIIIATLLLHRLQFLTCPEAPLIEQAMAAQSINPVDAIVAPSRFWSGLEKAFSTATFETTLDHLQFKGSYEVNYLPPTTDLASLIGITNTATLTVLALAILYTTARFGLLVWNSRGNKTKKELLLIAAFALGLGTPIALNLTRHWYDVAFLVGSIVVITALVQPIPSASPTRRFAPLLRAMSGICIIGSAILTLVVIQTSLTAQFKAGFEGPGVGVFTNKLSVAATVSDLTARHQIQIGDPIVVDDLTYDALKSHRVVIPISYLGLPTVPQSMLKELLERNNAHFSVTRCSLVSVLDQLQWRQIEKTAAVDGKALCLLTDK